MPLTSKHNEGRSIEEVFPSSNKSVGDASSVRGQMSTPVTTVSQPTIARPLEEQVQDTRIRSVKKSEADFYELSEDDILLDASIVAKPLMMNESYKIKVRDGAEYAYRWIEYRASNGLRFSQMKALGFFPADPNMVVEHQAELKEGKLYLGDTILMKMPKNLYAAHLKNNMMKSMAMMNPQKAMAAAKSRAGTITTGARGMPNMSQHKGEFFIAEGADVPVQAETAIDSKVYETITRD